MEEGEKELSVGIELKGIFKAFPSGGGLKPTLTGLDLVIPPCKVTSVLGQSGCGKTTLLKIISLLEPKDAGAVTFLKSDGSVFEKEPRISYVFQDPRLLPWKTVKQNIELAVREKPKEERDRLIAELLALMNLHGIENYYPAELSGGMAQRVGLARGLISHPDILLMDEPFSALDALTRMKLQKEFLELQQKLRMTVLLITHDINEALMLSDRIAIMKNGAIYKQYDNPAAPPRQEKDLIDLKQCIYDEIFNYP